MKKSVYLAITFLCFSLVANAQKYAFIDTDYILSKTEKYTKYEQQIETKSQSYQLEVTKAGEEIQKLYDAYQAKSKTLNEAQQKAEQERIMKLEKSAMELGRKYFGPEGEIAKLKEELLNPFHDLIYEAAKSIALKNDYAAIIDRATATSIIFAQPKYDISDEILVIINNSK